MNRVDLPWANTTFDLDGIEQVLTCNDLQHGIKVCSKCFSDIKPVFTCKKCGVNSCDACSRWALQKGSRLIAAYCGACNHRLGILI